MNPGSSISSLLLLAYRFIKPLCLYKLHTFPETCLGCFEKFDLGKAGMSKASFLLSKSNQSTAGISLGNKHSMFSVIIEGGEEEDYSCKG